MRRQGQTKITARAEICAMLEGTPSVQALRLRIFAVERLRADIAHFMDWPALVESLNRDAQALRCKLGEHVR